jgi:hypothetical protein
VAGSFVAVGTPAGLLGKPGHHCQEQEVEQRVSKSTLSRPFCTGHRLSQFVNGRSEILVQGRQVSSRSR